MTDALSPLERELLSELAADGEQTPAGLAVALDADLGTVLDAVVNLQERELLVRRAFTTCRLTERGRELAAAEVDSDRT